MQCSLPSPLLSQDLSSLLWPWLTQHSSRTEGKLRPGRWATQQNGQEKTHLSLFMPPSTSCLGRPLPSGLGCGEGGAGLVIRPWEEEQVGEGVVRC